MGLFSKIRQGIEGVNAAREKLAGAGTLGGLTIPGSESLHLPAGKVLVTFEYVERQGFGLNEPDQYWRRPEVALKVSGADGGVEFELDSSTTSATVAVGPPQIERSTWGKLTVPEAGTYEIVATPEHDWYAKRRARALFDPA